MLVSELFYSIQGEGVLSGQPSFFIRLAGCNLRCNWCDTDYASWNPSGNEMSIDEIVKHLENLNTCHVVVTGGEPMIAKDINQLCDKLEINGYHITIETAGTISPNNIECHLASISPKMSNSKPDARATETWQKRHERDRINIPVLNEWINNYDYQLKFVIDKKDDIDEILELLSELETQVEPHNVLLMPQGVTNEEIDSKKEMIVELCKEFGFRYCDRLHIGLFGNQKGT